MSTEQRTAIVTGANHGIGFETAAGLARAGCRVVMACRNEGKANLARDRILQSLPEALVEVMIVDLGDFSSVAEFAERFRNQHSRLDILINNAGILLYTIKHNTDGIELQFATNHLGHFLLTSHLIDMMPNDRASRVVSMSSVAHKDASIHFDDLSCSGDGGAAYGQSKLACLMFADELNRRLQAAGLGITSLAVHPGGSDSGLFDDMNRGLYYVLKLLSPFFTHSNASAARPSLKAALDTDVRGGEYYGPTGFREMRGAVGHAQRSKYSEDPVVAGRLWALSEELTGQAFRLPRADQAR